MQRLLIGKVFDGTVVFSVPDSFPSSYELTYNLLIYTSSKNTIYCEILKKNDIFLFIVFRLENILGCTIIKDRRLNRLNTHMDNKRSDQP